jgi:WD40 repeat protein/serine/threonine protein kinase
MTTSLGCPQPQQLAQLLAGKLTESEQSDLTAHLDQCSRCRAELERLASGAEAWQETARRLKASQGDRESESILQDVLARLRTGGTDTRSQGESGQSVEDVLAYLRPPREPGHLGQLAHYEVREFVGCGGMGFVFKAFDTQLHRIVAIKIMAPLLATSGSARQRFDREARAAAAVRNEHVVDIHAVGQENGLPYLVMEYIAGRSLQQRIDQAGPMGLKEILRIGLQAANGLAAAHAQGLIHRDIKPANILLENGVERVKLSDFGLARAVDDASLTQSGVVTGTPQYMSPEQADCETVDHRTDLFSLGSVLYTMCAGRPPFRAGTTLGVLRLVRDETPRPIREVNPDISERLAEIIARLHAKDPAERFQSAAEIAVALEQHLAEVQRPDWKRSAPPSEKPARTEVVPAAPRGPRRWTRPLRLRTVFYTLLVLAIAWILLVQYVDVVFFLQTGQLRIYGQVRVTEEPPDTPPAAPPAPKRPAVAVTIAPERLPEMAAGAPLNDLAVVIKPAPLPGVRSWTIETTHHRAAVEDVAFSPDGRWLASACRGGAVRIWEAKTQRLERILVVAKTTTAEWLRGLAWSPDSRYLAACQQNAAVELWEVETGRRLRTLRSPGPIRSIAWSPDGRSLSGAGWFKDAVIWDIPSGELRRQLKGHTDAIQGLAWSSDSKKLATGGDDKTAKVWDAETGQCLGTLEGHTGAVKAVTFAPYDGGSHLATASYDRTVRIWNTREGICTHTLKGHTGEVWAVAWSPDGKQLASGCTEWQVILWDPDAGKQIRPLVGHTHIVASLSWSPDSQTLASGSWDTTVALWSVGKRPGSTIPGVTAWSHNHPLWSPNGKYLATGAKNARLWNAETGEQIHVFADQCGIARAWSPDSKLLALTDWKGGLWFWDSEERSLRGSVSPHPDKVMKAAAWSPDGKMLATGDEGGNVALWGGTEGDWKKGQSPKWMYLTDFAQRKAGVTTLAFSHDSAWLAWAGADGIVHLWDVKRQKRGSTYSPHKKRIRTLAWAPNRYLIATSGEDNVVQLWEPQTGEMPHTLHGFHATVWALAFSPDGKTLATADGWGDVRLWDPVTGKQVRRLRGPTTPLYTLTFSSDGKRLAGGGELSTTHIWDLTTGQVQAVLIGLPLDEALAVGATGHYRCTPGVARDLVYVVQTDKGQETLTPEEFALKYHWKNDPQQVRLQR